MFGKLQLAQLEHFRTVDDRVHKNVLIQAEMADIVPAENLVLRKYIIIADDFFMGHADFLIHIIGDHHIYRRIRVHKSFDCLKDLEEGISVYPVVAVDDFKIFAGSVGQAAVDSVTVAAVFLIDGFHYGRIFSGILFGDLLCIVAGAVINDDDFHILSTRQYGMDCFFHISF